MTVSIDELQTWMSAKEDEYLEFEEAKTGFDFGRLLNCGPKRGQSDSTESCHVREPWNILPPVP